MKFLFLMLFLSCFLYSEHYTVTKVIDGDTVDIVGKDNKVTRIRLAFIDTLESNSNLRSRKLSKVCGIPVSEMVTYGKMSKSYLVNLVLNKKVSIISYGIDNTRTRLVAELFMVDSNISINDSMIKFGYAMPYYKYILKFKPTKKVYYDELRDKDIPILNNECLLKELH